jgi:hypothetical protein
MIVFVTGPTSLVSFSVLLLPTIIQEPSKKKMSGGLPPLPGPRVGVDLAERSAGLPSATPVPYQASAVFGPNLKTGPRAG